jgi:hypothetical protein
VPFEKQASSDAGKVTVVFRVPAEADANTVELVGEFTDWTPVAMLPVDGGEYMLTVDLDAGAAYRFRYRLDGDRWVNDWAADRYVPNHYGSDDSVVDLVAMESRPQNPTAPDPTAPDPTAPDPTAPSPAAKRTRAPRKAATDGGADGGTSKASKAAGARKPSRAPRKKSGASND